MNSGVPKQHSWVHRGQIPRIPLHLYAYTKINYLCSHITGTPRTIPRIPLHLYGYPKDDSKDTDSHLTGIPRTIPRIPHPLHRNAQDDSKDTDLPCTGHREQQHGYRFTFYGYTKDRSKDTDSPLTGAQMMPCIGYHPPATYETTRVVIPRPDVHTAEGIPRLSTGAHSQGHSPA